MSLNFQDLILLTSPPASGKTYWIQKLSEAEIASQILVISPLRALADECRRNWGPSLIVMTPEEWLGKKTFAEIVIFDEFHLFFYWGDTFRPLMWEVFFEISGKARQTFLLTATLSEEMKREISTFSSQFDQILWIDHGNQTLKFRPDTYIKAPNKNWIDEEIINQPRGDCVKLVFCKFREEVFQLQKKLESLKFSVVVCVGGESKLMANRLRQNPHPDFIIATTVLSHGVNLPHIQKIFFLYQVKNLDFWIQMVARGGRRGEKFQVFALENPEVLTWNVWRNTFLVFCLSMRRKFSPLIRFLIWTGE